MNSLNCNQCAWKTGIKLRKKLNNWENVFDNWVRNFIDKKDKTKNIK